MPYLKGEIQTNSIGNNNAEKNSKNETWKLLSQ